MKATKVMKATKAMKDMKAATAMKIDAPAPAETASQTMNDAQAPAETRSTPEIFFKTWFVRGRQNYKLISLQIDLEAGAIHETWSRRASADQ